MSAPGGSAPGGCLLPGESSLGGCLLQGGVCSPGDVCSGVCLLWGVYAPGVSAQGGVPVSRGDQVLPPCEQNDKQVQKYYLAPNFVCGR